MRPNETPARGFWCRARRRQKYGHYTIDEAWRAAFKLYAFDGRILTPYMCWNKSDYRAILIRYPHPNPWRFAPVMLQKFMLKRTRRKPTGWTRPCHYWHLTRSTDHILPAPARSDARP